MSCSRRSQPAVGERRSCRGSSSSPSCPTSVPDPACPHSAQRHDRLRCPLHLLSSSTFAWCLAVAAVSVMSLHGGVMAVPHPQAPTQAPAALPAQQQTPASSGRTPPPATPASTNGSAATPDQQVPPADPAAGAQGSAAGASSQACRKARLALLEHPQAKQCQLSQFDGDNVDEVRQTLDSICNTCMPEWDKLLKEASAACGDGDEQQSVAFTQLIVTMDSDLYCTKRASGGGGSESDNDGKETADPLSDGSGNSGDDENKDDEGDSGDAGGEEYCYITNAVRSYKYDGTKPLPYPEMPGELLCSPCVKEQSASLLQNWPRLTHLSSATHLPITSQQASQNVEVRGPLIKKIQDECGQNFETVHDDEKVEQTVAEAVKQREGEDGSGNDAGDVPPTLWGAFVALLLGVWLSVEL